MTLLKSNTSRRKHCNYPLEYPTALIMIYWHINSQQSSLPFNRLDTQTATVTTETTPLGECFQRQLWRQALRLYYGGKFTEPIIL
jgi:hypothetical protein